MTAAAHWDASISFHRLSFKSGECIVIDWLLEDTMHIFESNAADMQHGSVAQRYVYFMCRQYWQSYRRNWMLRFYVSVIHWFRISHASDLCAPERRLRDMIAWEGDIRAWGVSGYVLLQFRPSNQTICTDRQRITKCVQNASFLSTIQSFIQVFEKKTFLAA